MALNTQVWLSDIKEALNSSNQFNQFSQDHSIYVNNYRVHIPNAAAPSSITRNNSSLPLSPTTRTDSDLTYDLDKFSTDAKYVEDLEAVEFSYDLRQSIFRQDYAELNDTLNDWLLYKWAVDSASGSSMVETGGTITIDNLLSLGEKFDEDNVSRRGRYLVVDPSMAKDIYSIERFEQTNDLNNMISIDGYIGRVAGFNIFVRDTVLEATGSTGAYTIIQPDTATGVTGKPVALAWHQDFVSRALGQIEVFADEKNPLYQGSLLSLAVRMGGSELRSDGKGVYGLVKTE